MMDQMSDALTLLDRTDDYWVGLVCTEGRDFTSRARHAEILWSKSGEVGFA